MKNLKNLAIVVAMVSMWSTSALAYVSCTDNGICGGGSHCRSGYCMPCGGTDQDNCDKGQEAPRKKDKVPTPSNQKAKVPASNNQKAK